ncbi:MAG: 5'-methylthioadenosine/adenosylhomocysteine nucleosidase [Planctomycetes bacterium]|nr:5'-methylthioadenosine/adenosylhomocysteine nucleosidase [Planctomycetota bacterium]
MRHNKVIPAVCISVILLLGSCSSPVHYAGEAAEVKAVKEITREPVTAILGAFEQEIILLEDELTDAQEQIIEEIRFVSGQLRGKRVVIAYTGIGKVNAAMTTTLLIEHFKPDKVIFTGIAGAVNRQLQPGDIVIAEKTAHHDMGTVWPEGLFHKGVKNRLTGWKNPVFFDGDEQLLKLAERASQQVELRSIRIISGQRSPKVVKGVVVTGDAFIASAEKCAELRKKLNADAVEMEGAAVAQLCFQRGIGYLVIRSISDNADEGAVLDKQTFYLLAAKNSSSLVIEMLGLLGAELSSEKNTGSNKLKD